MRPGSVILTQEGMVFGTPEFMSPEQAQGKTLTPASDVYSLAVILYEVLTGKLPFDAKSAMDYIQLHVTGKPIPLNQRVPGKTFPPLLEQIVDRALAKRAEDRFASAADFGTSLQAVLNGGLAAPAAARAAERDDGRGAGRRSLRAGHREAGAARRRSRPLEAQLPELARDAPGHSSLQAAPRASRCALPAARGGAGARADEARRAVTVAP